MENQRHCVIPIHKPDKKELIFFFASGILVSIPFSFFFSQIYVYFPAFISIVLFAPLIEELAKVFPLFYRHGETEQSIVTLGLLIGLGFGIAEFVLYVFFLDTPFIARLPGIIFHTSSTAITAFGIAKKKFLPYYFVAVLLHLGNNFFAVLDNPLSIFAIAIIILTAYYLAWRCYRKASKETIVV
jgi:RsiW-degrading membrane proteinase PrsW (M82 family)